MFTPADETAASNKPIDRRFYPRTAPSESIGMTFADDRQGTILNISENGLLVSSKAALELNLVSRILISLTGMPYAAQVYARVIWTSEATRQSGLQLLNLTEHDREQIRKWVTVESLKSESRSRVAQFPARLARPAVPVFPEAFVAEAEPEFETAQVEPVFAAKRAARSNWISAVAPVVIGVLCVGAVLIIFKDRSARTFADVSRGNSAAVENRAADQPQSSDSSTASVAEKQDADKGAAISGDGSAAPSAASSSSDADKSRRETGLPANSSRVETENVGRNNGLAARNSTRQNGADSGSGGASNSSNKMAYAAAGTSSAIGASPIIASMRSPAPANTAAPREMHTSEIAAHETHAIEGAPVVIQMDAPAPTVLEVRGRGGFGSSTVRVPNERVLESSTVTMRIQRSVIMPAGRKWWPFGRSKKQVVVGELLSRVDPQMPRGQIGPDATVRVKAVVAGDGHVDRVEAISGQPALMFNVIKAVSEWRYQLSYAGDESIATESYIDVQFHPPASAATQPEPSAQAKPN